MPYIEVCNLVHVVSIGIVDLGQVSSELPEEHDTPVPSLLHPTTSLLRQTLEDLHTQIYQTAQFITNAFMVRH